MAPHPGFALAVAAGVLLSCARRAPPAPQPPPDDPPAGVPHLTLTPAALELTWRPGEGLPSQEVRVGNSGAGILGRPLVVPSIFWLEARVEAREDGAFALTLSVDPAGLAPGRHEAYAKVWSNAGNSPAVVAVALEAVPAAEGSISRVLIASGGFLLTGKGDGYRPAAYAYDGQGAPVLAPITWRASDPELLSFDPNGVAWGGAGKGAAVIVAEAGGVSSPPAVALVASPAPGAVVVEDGELAAMPMPLHPAPAFGPGWRFAADFFRVTPYPEGTLLVSRGPLPFAGRVVEYVGGGRRAILEAVPLPELFPELELALDLPLHELIETAAVTPGVACTGAGGAEISLAGLSLPPPDLDLHVEYAGGLRALRLAGRVTAAVGADLSMPEGFEGEVECTAGTAAVELPWPGALLLAMPSRLTYGAGLVLSAETSGPVHAAPEVTLDATVDAGLRRGEGGAARLGGCFEVEADAALHPSPAGAAYRVEARPGILAELSMGPAWLWSAPVPLLGARVGGVADVEWAPAAEQASSAVRSSWALATSAGAEPRDEPSGVLEHLALAGGFSSLEVDPGTRGALWASATGVLAACPARITAGQPVEVTASLDPLVAPPGLGPVSRVEVLRRIGALLAPFCAAPATAPDQRTFICSATPADVVAGDRIELHGFAVDPGGALPTALTGGAPVFVDVD